VLVGYGQVGRIVAAGIKADGGGLVVIEDSDHDVAAARAEGFEVIFGNAASQSTLQLANLPQARNLLIAISNGFEAGSVCESGRKLNRGIAIIARAYSEEEESFLRNLGATTVIRGEREIGKGILQFLRSEGVTAKTSENNKLPTSENILASAAMGAALTEAAMASPAEESPPAEAETEPAEPAAEIVQAVEPASIVVTEAEPDASTELVVSEPASDVQAEVVMTEPALESPSVDGEITVLEVELPAASDTTVIELPPPVEEPDASSETEVVDVVEAVVTDEETATEAIVAAEAEPVPAAEIVAIEPPGVADDLPITGEAPAGIDEVVPPPVEEGDRPADDPAADAVEEDEDDKFAVPPVEPEPKG
jgi:monovalent cation:H+ antiporter-2, CPA2 family